MTYLEKRRAKREANKKTTENVHLVIGVAVKAFWAGIIYVVWHFVSKLW